MSEPDRGKANPSSPGTSPPTAGAPPSRTSRPSRKSLRTRITSTNMSVWAGVVILVLVLIFIIQNLKDASVHYLGLRFRLPLGILILIGVVAGVVIVLLASLARVAGQRLRARRPGRRRPK